MPQIESRKLTAAEIAKVSREDMLTLIGPSVINAGRLTDEQLREIIATMYFQMARSAQVAR